jgi:hypothetical protein
MIEYRRQTEAFTETTILINVIENKTLKLLVDLWSSVWEPLV